MLPGLSFSRPGRGWPRASDAVDHGVNATQGLPLCNTTATLFLGVVQAYGLPGIWDPVIRDPPLPRHLRVGGQKVKPPVPERKAPSLLTWHFCLQERIEGETLPFILELRAGFSSTQTASVPEKEALRGNIDMNQLILKY